MTIDAKTVLGWEKLILGAGLRVTSVSSQIASRSYLTSLFSAARKTPNNIPIPNVVLVADLGKLLGLTLDEMMQLKSQVRVSGSASYKSALGEQAQSIVEDLGREIARRQNISVSRPSVEDVLNWWRQNNGRLEACGRIEESFDLIKVPSAGAGKVEAYSVGGMSFAALHLGTSKDRLSRLLDLLPPAETQDMVVSYQRAAGTKSPTFSSPLKMSVRSPSDDISLDAEYIRMQLPVITPNRTELIISYCF